MKNENGTGLLDERGNVIRSIFDDDTPTVSTTDAKLAGLESSLAKLGETLGAVVQYIKAQEQEKADIAKATDHKPRRVPGTKTAEKEQELAQDSNRVHPRAEIPDVKVYPTPARDENGKRTGGWAFKKQVELRKVAGESLRVIHAGYCGKDKYPRDAKVTRFACYEEISKANGWTEKNGKWVKTGPNAVFAADWDRQGTGPSAVSRKIKALEALGFTVSKA